MLEKVLKAISSRTAVNGQVLVGELAATGSRPRWRRGVVPYVLFQVSCDGGKDITAPLAAAVRIIQRPGCVLEANLSTMLFVTFPGIHSGDGAQLRDEVAAKLMKKLGRRVRLIKGMINGVGGEIGRGEHYVKGTAFLGLEKLCTALFTQSYGYYNNKDLTPGINSDSQSGAENGEAKRAEVVDVW